MISHGKHETHDMFCFFTQEVCFKMKVDMFCFLTHGIVFCVKTSLTFFFVLKHKMCFILCLLRSGVNLCVGVAVDGSLAKVDVLAAVGCGLTLNTTCEPILSWLGGNNI